MDYAKGIVRGFMRVIAKLLNQLTGGKLSPNAVTLVGLVAHLPIAYLIAQQKYFLAGTLLIIFGLFDALDGELARLQKSDGPKGMLLDSVTDRMKEIMLYIGAATSFVAQGYNYAAVWAVAAVGCSILVSYVNAWGDVIAYKHNLAGHSTNKSLRGGVMSFEVRMVTLIIGLLTNQLILATAVVAGLGFYTALGRMQRLIKQLP